MTEAAQRRMTVEEFLDWHDGTDIRHMLIDGVIVAMAPPSQRHSTIAVNVALAIRSRIKPPCRVLSEAGLKLADDTCAQADVAMTCEPPEPARLIEAPVLLVEVLSPSTRKDDLGIKVPAYKELPTVREIWAVDSERRTVRLTRRLADGQWLESVPIREGAVRSEVLESEVALEEIYAGTGL